MMPIGRLTPGVEISYWDCGTSGRPEAQIARVVRARGSGVLVVRDGLRYRVRRQDVIRILPTDVAGEEELRRPE